MKVIFLGTPEFAVTVLKALYSSDHEVVAVISQPDRAKDRKGNPLPTPVKAFALQVGLPLYQFASIRNEGVDILKSFGADIMVTAAYGQILTKEILDIAPYGVVNVHASLLPKYRGSAPVQWAVINGEKQTGVTVMQTAIGVDDGDMLAAVKTEIGENETSGELMSRLSEMGALLLLDTLKGLESGAVKAVPQNDAESSRCRMLKKQDGHIDFGKSVKSIVCRCNGVTPSPGAFAFCGNDVWKIGKIAVGESVGLAVGEVKAVNGKIEVGCLGGSVSLERLQLPGKKMLDAADFLRGHKIADGTRLS